MNDENEMSTEEFSDAPTTSNGSAKTRRTKSNKALPASKNHKQATVEPIQYGPILVKPRKHVAPTLANGRRSKDDMVRMERSLSSSHPSASIFSYHPRKMSSASNVAIETNTLRRSVARSATNCAKNWNKSE